MILCVGRWWRIVIQKWWGIICRRRRVLSRVRSEIYIMLLLEMFVYFFEWCVSVYTENRKLLTFIRIVQYRSDGWNTWKHKQIEWDIYYHQASLFFYTHNMYWWSETRRYIKYNVWYKLFFLSEQIDGMV